MDRIREQGQPESTPHGRQQCSQKGALPGGQVDDLLGLHLVDLTDGNGQAASLHIRRRAEAAHHRALGGEHLGGLHHLGDKPAAYGAGCLNAADTDDVRLHGSGVDHAIAVDLLCDYAIGHFQRTLYDEMIRGQAFIVDSFTLGDINGFHVRRFLSLFVHAAARYLTGSTSATSSVPSAVMVTGETGLST